MKDDDALYLVYAVLSCASAFGCIFIITVYCLYKELQIFAFRLIRDLAILDLLHSIAWALPPYDPTVCVIQGVALSFISPMCILWTSVIAYTMYRHIIQRKVIKRNSFLIKSMLLVSGASLVLALFPLLLMPNPYGDTGGWCWIANDSFYGKLGGMLNFYIPLLLVLLYNSFVSIAVIRTIHKEFSSVEGGVPTQKTLVIRLVLYPFILMICYSLTMVLRIYQLATDSTPLVWEYLGGSAASSYGLLNAVAYGFNASVRQSLSHSCCAQQTDPKMLESLSI